MGRREYPDIREISGQTVEVKAITDDEIARDIEAHIIGSHIALKRLGLEEQ